MSGVLNGGNSSAMDSSTIVESQETTSSDIVEAVKTGKNKHKLGVDYFESNTAGWIPASNTNYISNIPDAIYRIEITCNVSANSVHFYIGSGAGTLAATILNQDNNGAGDAVTYTAQKLDIKARLSGTFFMRTNAASQIVYPKISLTKVADV